MSAHPQAAGTRRAPRRRAAAGAVRVTHPDRVMDAASGLRKAELVAYHAQIADWLMPFARRRPLALVRCPDGSAAPCFFQKQATPGFSDAILRRRIAGRETLGVRSARALQELAQFNVMELHGWGARWPAWGRPDWLVMDLDPGAGVGFAEVTEAALEMKELLATLGLESFVKTTGGRGLHVVAPLRPLRPWDEIGDFTEGLARHLAQRAPERYVAAAGAERRAGRIFVDYLRNRRGATAVLPYSPRARTGATVAMPLAWTDLRRADPREFTVRSVPAWLQRRRRDPWARFFTLRQDLAARLDAAVLD